MTSGTICGNNEFVLQDKKKRRHWTDFIKESDVMKLAHLKDLTGGCVTNK